METNLYCDAVVVGTGLGGSTFANGLAQRGMKVVIVDEGESIKPSGSDLSPVPAYLLDGRPNVGGLTKFFGAAMPRFREMDFRATQMESGESPAWPFSYSDLES